MCRRQPTVAYDDQSWRPVDSHRSDKWGRESMERLVDEHG